MRITVLVPTWQPVPPVYPAFEVPNAITRLPPDSAHPVSERVGRDTWSGIVRNYQVTPLLPASFELGGEPIRITRADPGTANIVSDVIVPIRTLTARIPAGAEGIDPFLAGRELDLERTFEGDLAALSVGDGLVVHYRAELDGMPAVFIPPLAPDLVSDLVTVYPKEPVVRDGDRAERLETLTLVLEHGGELVLPGRTLEWWNQTDQRIEQARLEPITLTIAGPPPAPAAEPSAPWKPWPFAVAALAAVLAALGIRRGLTAFLARRRAARKAYEESEACAFGNLLCTDTPATFYPAAVAWLHRLDPALDLRKFAGTYGDPTLLAALDRLSGALFGNDDQTPDVGAIKPALCKARERYQAQVSTTRAGQLAPLNPG